MLEDLKYQDLVDDQPDWDTAMKALDSIKSDVLKPIAEAFQANMGRTAIFALLPAQITADRMRDAVIACNAHYRVNKQERPLSDLIHGALTNEIIEHQAAQAAEISLQWTDEQRNTMLWNSGVTVFAVTSLIDPIASVSLKALFTSVILESWLFFEALVSDLWVAAVDNGGKLITGRAGSVPRKKPDDSMPKIEEMDANFRTHPGSFWREAGIVTFQKKRDIVEHYSVVFGPEIKIIFDKTADGYVWALNAYRNCITHSAGRVDHNFRKQAAQFEEFRNLPLKSRLQIDGTLTARLRNAALLTGVSLLQKVDEMLQRGD